MLQQRNWLLIVGVSLPGLLLAGFFGYSFLARGVVEPPHYDLYFSIYRNRTAAGPQHATVQYSVSDGRIVVQAIRAPNPVYSNQVLYRLDHETLQAIRVDIELTVEIGAGYRRLDVPELSNVRVSPDLAAPDGYRFRSGYRRGPGLIGGLFYPNRGHGFSIEKLGIAHRIEAPDGSYSYGQAQFLGWVLGDE
jgi:hypothetical protein